MDRTVSFRAAGAASVALVALLAAAGAAACPTAVPAGLKAESVGDSTVVNGLPVTIRQVTGAGRVEDVLARIEQAWADEGHDVRRHQSGQWAVLSARSPACNTTLQLADQQGVFGYLAVGEPQRSVAWLPKGLGVTLPTGATLNSTVSSRDGGRQGHTLAFSTRRGVADINDYFLNHLSKVGWSGVTSHELRMGTDRRARVVKAQKGREQIAVVLWDDGQTRAILNVWESL